MGLSTTVVLIASNVVIAALRKFIPNTVRMLLFHSELCFYGYNSPASLQHVPDVSEALGIYIPLIVVNCIIFGPCQAYAAKHSVGLSLFEAWEWDWALP